MASAFDTRKAYEIPEKRALIIKMAKYYTCIFNKKVTLSGVATKFGVSRRTVSKYFNEDLPMIDSKLSEKVDKKSKKAITQNYFKPAKK